MSEPVTFSRGAGQTGRGAIHRGNHTVLMLLVTVVLGGLVVLISWLQSRERTPDAYSVLSYQGTLINAIERDLVQWSATQGRKPDGLRDSLRESMDRLAQDYNRVLRPSGHEPPVPPTVEKLLIQQATDRRLLANCVQGLWSGGERSQEVSAALEACHRLQQSIQWASDSWLRFASLEGHSLNMVELGITAVSITVLLLLGLFVFKRESGQISLALDLAETTRLELDSKVQRLGEIQGQLESVKARNLDIEDRLEKALMDAETANEIMQFASHRFRELFAGLPIACFTTDANGTIFEWNRAASELFGCLAETVYQQSATDAFPIDTDRQILANAIQRAAEGEMIRDLEWRARSEKGGIVDVLTRAFPVRTPRGEVTGVVVSCFDETERKAAAILLERQLQIIQEMNLQLEDQKIELESANSRLHALATTDGLTGLNNHRTFQSLLRETMGTVSALKPVSLILLDVDHFKSFNDTFGHQAGDDVLRGVAEVLLRVSGKVATPARYGGEEFVVLCPGCSGECATELAESLRKAIESHPWEQRQVTASFGVASTGDAHADTQTLIARADRALYASKENGRNCVSVSDDTDLAA